MDRPPRLNLAAPATVCARMRTTLMFAVCLVAVAACGQPGFTPTRLVVLGDGAGQASVFIDEARHGNGVILDRRRRQGLIALAGTVHREQRLTPDVLLRAPASDSMPRLRYRGVERHTNAGRALVRLDDARALPPAALALLESGVAEGYAWSSSDGRLYLYRPVSDESWLYTIDGDVFAGALEVATPVGFGSTLLMDRFADPPIALLEGADGYYTAALECAVASCSLVPETHELALLSDPTERSRLVRLASGEPVVVGTCPAAGCDSGTGLPLVYPGGTTWLPIPTGTATTVAARARPGGGLLVLQLSTAGPGASAVMHIVDADWTSRAHVFELESYLEPTLYLAEQDGAEVAHLLMAERAALRHVRIELATDEMVVETLPLPALL